MKKPTIYLDMDGVLADFDTAARTLIRATREEQLVAQQTGRWPDHKYTVPNTVSFAILPLE